MTTTSEIMNVNTTVGEQIDIPADTISEVYMPNEGSGYSRQNPNDFKRKPIGKFDMKSIRKAHNKKHKK